MSTEPYSSLSGAFGKCSRDQAQLLRLVPPALLLCALGMYGLLAPLTAHRQDADWSHLWLGGRMVAVGRTDDLYRPEAQIEVYRRSNPAGEPPAVWRPRNDVLGCFNYPPPAAVGYALVAWLPMSTAAMVNAYASILLAVMAAFLLAGVIRPGVGASALGLAVLAYPPFFVDLAIGQNAAYTLTVLLMAWVLAARRQDFWAGLVLGLLVCKPNWLVAVGWIPLVHGRWRLLSGLALGSAGVVLATAVVVGVQPFLDYRVLFSKVARIHELPFYDLDIKYSGVGLFRKWLGATSPWVSAATWACNGAVIFLTWRATRGQWRPGEPTFHRMMACCLLAALWINPHLNHYDLLPLAPCLAVLLLDAAGLRRKDRLAALLLVLLNYAAVPWDQSWPMSVRLLLPVPTFGLLAAWAWLWRRCRSHQPNAVTDCRLVPQAANA